MTPTKVHDWRIDEREYARHEARRGRRHAFDTIDPRQAALVVVDLVPFFVSENPYAQAIVPNVNRLAAALRSTGGTVAWVVPAAEPPVAGAGRVPGVPRWPRPTGRAAATARCVTGSGRTSTTTTAT